MGEKSCWNVYRTRFLVRARQLTQPLVFTDSLGREHSGQSGDYLVETSDGVRRITSRALFEDIYVPLGPASLPRPSLVVQKRPSSEDLSASASRLPLRPVPGLHQDPPAKSLQIQTLPRSELG